MVQNNRMFTNFPDSTRFSHFANNMTDSPKVEFLRFVITTYNVFIVMNNLKLKS